MVKIVKKEPELYQVTIKNRVFATFRGENAMNEAIACAESLTRRGNMKQLK